jgi:amidohydrolase
VRGVSNPMISTDQSFIEQLVLFRKRLHQNPELAFDVSRTSKLIADELRDAGLDVITDVGRNGIVASLNKGSGVRPIGFRADMDALPITEANTFEHASISLGRFHGCGHDGHSTMLLGAAKLLALSNDCDREIHFIFQPDEENGNGALAMIEAGLFDRFEMDAIYGLHNLPGLAVGEFALNPGAFCAFEDNFEISILGKGGHSSMPEKVIDALVIGAKIVCDLQSIVSRTIAPSEHAVVSVTDFSTDGARNVIASQVSITGDCRGFEKHISESIRIRMEAIVRANCDAYGADYRFDYSTSFVPLINNPEHAAVCAKVANTLAGATADAEFGRVSFSEDFAQMLNCKPGAYILMGNGQGHENHGQPLHNPSYDFNDQALSFGVEYWCALARYLP